MKLALLNPHGWEVLDGDGAGLTAPLGRESLVLYQGESMSQQNQSDNINSILPTAIHATFTRDDSSKQELGAILTDMSNLFVDVLHNSWQSGMDRAPLQVTAIKRLDANGTKDFVICSSDVVGLNGRIEMKIPVGTGCTIAIVVSGGRLCDPITASVFTSNM